MGRTTIDSAHAAAALLLILTACTSNPGDGGADAAAEGSMTARDQGDASLDDAGATACLEAGGQCEVGAVCGLFLGPQACGPGGAMCCLSVVCAADAEVRIIQASDYDQSCVRDSDCVEVHVGNACNCEIGCETTPAAINRSSEPLYMADVARTLQLVCSCLPQPPVVDTRVPCCVGGQCQFGRCLDSVPVDAATNTGTDAAGE